MFSCPVIPGEYHWWELSNHTSQTGSGGETGGVRAGVLVGRVSVGRLRTQIRRHRGTRSRTAECDSWLPVLYVEVFLT